MDPAMQKEKSARLAAAARSELEELQGACIGRLKTLQLGVPLTLQKKSLPELRSYYQQLLPAGFRQCELQAEELREVQEEQEALPGRLSGSGWASERSCSRSPRLAPRASSTFAAASSSSESAVGVDASTGALDFADAASCSSSRPSPMSAAPNPAASVLADPALSEASLAVCLMSGRVVARAKLADASREGWYTMSDFHLWVCAETSGEFLPETTALVVDDETVPGEFRFPAWQDIHDARILLVSIPSLGRYDAVELCDGCGYRRRVANRYLPDGDGGWMAIDARCLGCGGEYHDLSEAV